MFKFEPQQPPLDHIETAPARVTAKDIRARLSSLPTAIVGGLKIVALDRQQTADLMIEVATAPKSTISPVLFSSANGEVLSACASDEETRSLFETQHVLSADGAPLAIASRFLCKTKLPERVATTDLFHDVAKRAEAAGVTFYLLGSSESENLAAVKRTQQLYPNLKIAGRSHGYLTDAEWDAKVDEINALAPGILWIGLGVPREQQFCLRYHNRLTNVRVIKTSGGLFNFLSGTRSRAPIWMQRAALEWLWRLAQEPRRLFARYARTNPHAIYLLLTRSM